MMAWSTVCDDSGWPMGKEWVNPLDIEVELTETLPTGHSAFTPRRRH
jgi:hypothetical protein